MNAPNAVHLTTPPPIEHDRARSQFVELYGSTAVTNTYLKIVILIQSAILMASFVFNLRLYSATQTRETIVVRINEMGRPEANTSSRHYEPQEAELKYFLTQFVQQHYGRMRATVQENFSRSLYFLDGRLAEDIMDRAKKDKAIESVMVGQAGEVDVRVTGVAIEDTRQSPYRATVEYEKVQYTSGARQDSKRQKFVGNFIFSLKDHVPNEMIPINPLGFTITYFREDQKFE